MPEEKVNLPINELKLTEKHEYNWAGRVIIEMRPLDGPVSMFFLTGGLQVSGRKGTFTKRVEGVATIQEAYTKFDETFEAGKAEVMQSLAGRIVVPGSMPPPNLPGNNGRNPGRGRLGNFPQ